MIETNTLTETTDSKKIFCENNTKRQEENKATDSPQRDRPNDLSRSHKDSVNTKPTVDSETQEKTVHCSSERDAKCTETPLVQKICPTEKSNQFYQTNLPDKTVKHKLKDDVITEFDKSTKHSHEHLRKKRNGGNVDNEPYEPSELSSNDSAVVVNTNIGNPLRCDNVQNKKITSVKTDGSINDDDVSRCNTIETEILDVVKNIRRVTEELFQVKKTFSDYSAIPEKSAHTFKQHDDTYNKQCDSTHLNRDVKLQLSENSGKNSNGSNMNGGNDLNSIDHLTCDDTTDTKYHKRYNTDTCKAKDIICKQNSSSINDALHKKKLKIPTFLEEIVQAKIIPVEKRTQSLDHVQNNSAKDTIRSHSVSECTEEHNQNIGNRNKYDVRDCTRNINIWEKSTGTIERNRSRKFEMRRSLSESKEKQYTKYEGKSNYRNTDINNRRLNYERYDTNDKNKCVNHYSDKDNYRNYSHKDQFTSHNTIANCGNYPHQSYSRNCYFNNRRKYGNIEQYRNYVENNIHRNRNEHDNFRKTDEKYNKNHQQKAALKDDHEKLNQQNYSMKKSVIKLKQTVEFLLEMQCDSTQIICSKQDNLQTSSSPNTENRFISGKISSVNGSSKVFPTHVSNSEAEAHLKDNHTSKCEVTGNSEGSPSSKCETMCYLKQKPSSKCNIKHTFREISLTNKATDKVLSKLDDIHNPFDDKPSDKCVEKDEMCRSTNVETGEEISTVKCIAKEEISTSILLAKDDVHTAKCVEKEKISTVTCVGKDEKNTNKCVANENIITAKCVGQQGASTINYIANAIICTAERVEKEEINIVKCVSTEEMNTSIAVKKDEINTTKCVENEELSTTECVENGEESTAKCEENDEESTAKCVEKDEISTAKCEEKDKLSPAKCIEKDDISTATCVQKEELGTTKCVEKDELSTAKCVEKDELSTAKCVQKEELGTTKCVEKDELSTAKCVEKDESSTAKCIEKEELSTTKRAKKEILGTTKCIEKEEIGTAKCIEEDKLIAYSCGEKDEISRARCVDNVVNTSTNAKCDSNYTSQAIAQLLSEEKCISIKTSQLKVKENKTVFTCKTMATEQAANTAKFDTKLPEIHSNKNHTAHMISDNSKSKSPGKNHGPDVTKQENPTKVPKKLKQITHKNSIPSEFIIPESDTNDKNSYDEVVETNSFLNDGCTHHLHEEAMSVMKPNGSSNCCKPTNTNGGHQATSNAIPQIGNSINAESKLLKTIKDKVTTLLKKSLSESRNSDTLKTKKRLAPFNNVGNKRKYAKTQCGMQNKKNVECNKNESTNAIDLTQMHVDSKVNTPLPREKKRKIELLASPCTITKEAKCSRLIKDASRLKQSRQSGLSKKSKRNIITDPNTSEKLKCERRDVSNITPHQNLKCERRDDANITPPHKSKCERRDVSNITRPQILKCERRDVSNITPPQKLKCERRDDSNITPPQILKCKRGDFFNITPPQKLKYERRDVSNNTPPRRVWAERVQPRRRQWYDTKDGYDNGRHRYSCSRNSEHESYYNERTSTIPTREDTSTRTWPSVSSVVTNPMPNTKEENADVRFGHERCFNAVHVYAFNCLKRFYSINKHLCRIPVEEFRYQLRQQLKRNFDRYLYDANDPIYSNMGPQPRFVSEDAMIRSIAETIINPHTFADRERQFHEFDEIVGFVGYNIPCYWCEVDFRHGQFFRAFPVLDPIGYRDDTMYCQ